MLNLASLNGKSSLKERTKVSLKLSPGSTIENLKGLATHFDTIVFLSYWTTFPEADTIPEYLEKIQHEILSSGHSEFWVLGKMAHYIPTENLNQKISVFTTLQHALNKL